MNSRGFTLVEGLVAISVTSLVVLVVTVFMINNIQQSTLASARQNMLRELQQTLDLAANDIRLSANADTNNRWPDSNSPSGASSPYSWTSNANTLVLATAAEDQSGTVIFSDPQNYVTVKNNIIFFVQNGTLYKRTLAADDSNNASKTTCPAASANSACPADKELLTNVQSFTVTYLDGQNQSVIPTNARSIELRAQTSKQLYSQTVRADYTTKMVFRND